MAFEVNSVTLETSKINQQIQEIEGKAEKTSDKVDTIVQKSNEKVDLTFIKTVQTIGRIGSIVSQAVSIFGKGLSQVARASISFVIQTINTLTPILTAQTFTPWTALQGALGIIALGQGAAQLAVLVIEERDLSNNFSKVNQEIGSENWWY